MYSRTSPSKYYAALIEQFTALHEDGVEEKGILPLEVYVGMGVLTHLDNIKNLVRETDTNLILDYGSGKGTQYGRPLVDVGLDEKEMLIDYWDVMSVQCYDPCYKLFTELPDGNFDAVIAINVLECIHVDDIEWVLMEIFSKANLFVYLAGACYEAQKNLPNGLNCHATVRDPQWWNEKIKKVAMEFPDVKWTFSFSCLEKNEGEELEIASSHKSL